MAIVKQTGALLLTLVTVIGMSRLPIIAQEPADPKTPPPTARKKQDPARRVPPYFGQIGLTTEQRAGIYGIQSKRLEKIEALEKQIDDERALMLSECEGVLNETQKKLLENLRRDSIKPAELTTPAKKPAS